MASFDNYIDGISALRLAFDAIPTAASRLIRLYENRFRTTAVMQNYIKSISVISKFLYGISESPD